MQQRHDPRRPVDPVEEAGLESFPASDPPAWVPAHVGAPVDVEALLESHSGAREVWNAALERAARYVEATYDTRDRRELPDGIRAMKRAEPG